MHFSGEIVLSNSTEMRTINARPVQQRRACVCLYSAAVLQGVGDRQTGVSEDHDVYAASDAETAHGLPTEVRRSILMSTPLGTSV